MASPFKTHETMDLARALLEEDSDSTAFPHSPFNNNVVEDFQKSVNNPPLDLQEFDNLVISKDSSTELIPTHLGPQSGVVSSKKGNNTPTMTMVRDLNAGKGMLDDDGKPAVGKVFSRVIQISGDGGKPKQLKAHHRGRSTSSCCKDRQDKERSSSARPQSGQQERCRAQGGGQQRCPTCNRQFSDEAVMEHHIVFCTGSSKDIM